MDVAVTHRQVAREVALIKRESFKDGAEFRRLLKEVRYTRRDVNERVEIQMLGTRLQRRLSRQDSGGGIEPSAVLLATWDRPASGACFTACFARPFWPRPVFTAFDHAVEVLDRAADLAFVDDFDQAGATQLGHVVVDGAQRRLQLQAEVLGRQRPPFIDAQHFQD